MSNLREAFVQSDLPFRIDIVDWASISESFRQVIKKKCAVVQEKSAKKKNPIGWRPQKIGSLGHVVTGKTPSTRELYRVNQLGTSATIRMAV